MYSLLCFPNDDDDFIPRNTPPLTQHTAAKRPAAPTHECTGPAITGPRRIATEEKGTNPLQDGRYGAARLLSRA